MYKRYTISLCCAPLDSRSCFLPCWQSSLGVHSIQFLTCLTSSPPPPQSISEDVERSSELMLTQLVQQLQGSIQLPACLHLVGLMKRMGVFSETQLRLKFLQVSHEQTDRQTDIQRGLVDWTMLPKDVISKIDTTFRPMAFLRSYENSRPYT